MNPVKIKKTFAFRKMYVTFNQVVQYLFVVD
jgi:hypothetical protein